MWRSLVPEESDGPVGSFLPVKNDSGVILADVLINE